MGWDSGAGVKFSQDSQAAVFFVFMKDQQFHPGIRAGLPGFIFGERDILKHALSNITFEKFASIQFSVFSIGMLLFREKVPADWVPKVLANLPAVLVDHAHLERKAATTALNLEKYRDLYGRVEEINAIAIEELQHFQLVLDLLKKRGIPFGQPFPSPWITGLMRSVRNGARHQAIDHLICCALIEGRSCEKFQILAEVLKPVDAELATFYASLVESEGNHYATYWLMARNIDEPEADRRLDFYLDLDAQLMRLPNPHPILH